MLRKERTYTRVSFYDDISEETPTHAHVPHNHQTEEGRQITGLKKNEVYMHFIAQIH